MNRYTNSPAGRPVRMRDVAAAAGVSTTTVSVVLQGKGDGSIPVETQERVREAGRQLGYRPNGLASGLRRQTSDTIGFISDYIATTPFAGAMIQGAQDAAWAAGKVIAMVNTGGDPKIEARALDDMLQRRFDALVYATMWHRLVEPPASIAEVPAVLLDCRSEGGRISSVAPDEFGGAYDAATHLIEAGHSRIGYLQNEDAYPASAERLAGYRRALEDHGLTFDESLVASAASTTHGGQDTAADLLARPDRPTAIFCFNDRMAMGAYRAARRLGISIPDELSVVGFDNQDILAPWLDPPLTTMQLPHYEMGRWAVEYLLSVLEGSEAEPQHRRMPCPLVPRESVVQPAGGRLIKEARSDET